MKIQSFNGGVNTKLRPQFLKSNQAAVYENVDNEVGSLAPVQDLLATGIQLRKYHTYYHHEDEWVDSDTHRDYVEFQKNLYWTDRLTKPQKYDGTTQANLGVEVPTGLGYTDVLTASAAPSVSTTASFGTGTLENHDQYYLLVAVDGAASLGRLVKVNTSNAVSSEATNISVPTKPKVGAPVDSKQKSVTISNFTASGELRVFRYYKYVWRLVGTLTDSTAQLVDDVNDIGGNRAIEGQDLPGLDGTYQYLMTYYNINDGSESGPSVITEELVVKAPGYVRFLSLEVPTDPQVTHRRLYRVGGNIAKFTMVAEIPIAQTTWYDTTSDAMVEGDALPTPYAAPAPVGLSFITEAYAMLFGAVDEYLRFTPIGAPDSWPETYFIQYESPITGIAPVANGILVFTQFKTHIVTGTSPEKLSTYLLSGDQGCIEYNSVQIIGTEAVWASTDGICRSSGNRPDVMSKQFYGKLALNPVDSCVYDEVYYLLNEDGKMFAFGEGIAKNYDFAVQTMTVAKDELYGYKAGQLWKMFQGDTPASFTYKSPKFSAGSFTANKSYKKVFVYSKGHVIINIMIDDVVVQTKELTNEDNHQIQVPQDKQRGYSIQFEITGTGEVYEIDFDEEVQKR